jgi:hypothetical protein
MLLAIAVNNLVGGSEVTLWTFPRDDAMRFAADGDGSPTIEVLNDAFSRRSTLRKAAILRGAGAGVTEFLGARAADLQTGGSGQSADYWIHEFLHAELSLAAGVGSQALAHALREAWESAGSEDDRDHLYAAAISVRASTTPRTSLTRFAEDYLTGSAKATFLRTKGARDCRARQFAFEVEAFDRVANFRIVRTKEGLRISAPFSAAGQLLDFADGPDGDGRRVTATGIVVDDKVAARA